MAPMRFSRAVTALLIFIILAAAATNATGKTISVPPSGQWSHGDGTWSTFNLTLGTPQQTLQLLPGTSATTSNSIWVLVHEGCASNTTTPRTVACPAERGAAFDSEASETWSTERLENGGLFTLNAIPEGALGLGGNGLYGFDTVSLASAEGDGQVGEVVLTNQLVAGIATMDFWTGSLPLSPVGFNFTNFRDPYTSLLSSLKAAGQIGSLSWGYTAGARYRDPETEATGDGTLGSLTLGGWDENRAGVEESQLAVGFGFDVSADLTIAVQAISHNALGAGLLLVEGIYVLLDSMVAQLWLPLEVCERFERAFNLTWDEATHLYLVDDEVHDALVEQNAVISFTLGSTVSGGEILDISLPYAAFDQTIDPPYVNETTRYFPLKRADNDTQYVLGRTFFQEAYIIADYERQQFRISQAVFPDTPEASSVVAITEPEPSTVPEPTGPPDEADGDEGMSTGGIVGTAIAIAVVVVAATVLAWFLLRRRRRSHERLAQTDAEPYGPEKSQDQYFSDHKADPNLPVEVEADREADPKTPVEVEAAQAPQPEMRGDQDWRFVNERPRPGCAYEMPGSEVEVAELGATSRFREAKMS